MTIQSMTCFLLVRPAIMKQQKLKPLFLVSIALAWTIPAGTSWAFHDGGVGNCDGCHTMHNSSGGLAMTKNGLPPGTANKYLLQGSDPSSTCLVCHAGSTPNDSYKVATNPFPGVGSPPLQLTPGGDFAYLLKNYNWI